MGVIRDVNDLFFTGYIEDELGLPENDNVELEEDIIITSSVCETRPKSKSKISRNKKRVFDEKCLLAKTRIGVRRARRVENLQYLMSMVEKEDFNEYERVSLREPHVSVFAQLLMDQDNIEIWNDFVLGVKERKTKVKVEKVEEESEEEWEEIPDKRVVHPAFTAEESFSRLNINFKRLLRRRHIPLGLLEKLEDEVMTFFRDWPNSVFITEISCGFERLLLHHLCQFLCLHSSSKTKRGVRRTQVENMYEDFIPPETLLSKYIEDRIHH